MKSSYWRSFGVITCTHPMSLHVCNDASIIGAPFYLSAFLPGERVVNSIPDALNNVEEKVGMSRAGH